MSETARRILSSFVLAAMIIAALVFENFYWLFPFLLITVFSMLGVAEFYSLADRGYAGRPVRGVGYLFSFLIILGFYAHFLHIKQTAGLELHGFLVHFVSFVFPGSNLLPLLLVLFFISTMIVQIILRPIDGSIYSVAVTVFGVIYSCLPFALIFLIFSLKFGVFYIVFFILASEMTDAGAYFSGRWFGKHNAGLKISPRKTYEGYVGGVIVANLIAQGFLYGWRELASPELSGVPLGGLEVSVLTLFVSAITIFGDLAESSVKRDAKIKDSASLIPGHGGMLDLADALYFVLPLGYYYLHFKASLGFPI